MDPKDDVGETLLHHASTFGYLTIVTESVRCIQDRFSAESSLRILNARGHKRRTPLICAAIHGNSTVVDLLLQAMLTATLMDFHGTIANSAASKYGQKLENVGKIDAAR